MSVRFASASILALFTTGCFSLHATVPEEAVRYHLAKEEGIKLPAICAYEGNRFSEGAFTCMASRRMTCNADGRWVQDGTCS
jgi:hypothetical protein